MSTISTNTVPPARSKDEPRAIAPEQGQVRGTKRSATTPLQRPAKSARIGDKERPARATGVASTSVISHAPAGTAEEQAIQGMRNAAEQFTQGMHIATERVVQGLRIAAGRSVQAIRVTERAVLAIRLGNERITMASRTAAERGVQKIRRMAAERAPLAVRFDLERDARGTPAKSPSSPFLKGRAETTRDRSVPEEPPATHDSRCKLDAKSSTEPSCPEPDRWGRGAWAGSIDDDQSRPHAPESPASHQANVIAPVSSAKDSFCLPVRAKETAARHIDNDESSSSKHEGVLLDATPRTDAATVSPQGPVDEAVLNGPRRPGWAAINHNRVMTWKRPGYQKKGPPLVEVPKGATKAGSGLAWDTMIVPLYREDSDLKAEVCRLRRNLASAVWREKKNAAAGIEVRQHSSELLEAIRAATAEPNLEDVEEREEGPLWEDELSVVSNEEAPAAEAEREPSSESANNEPVAAPPVKDRTPYGFPASIVPLAEGDEPCEWESDELYTEYSYSDSETESVREAY